MSRYINVDETLKAMDTWDKFGYTHTGAFVRNPKTEDYVPYVHYEDMVNCVKNMPTADVVEVVHGEWVFNQFGEPHCSVCGNYPLQNGDESYALSRYCSYCGAKMGGTK